MERQFTCGSYMDYLFLFGDARTAYSDYSVKNALESGGFFLISWEKETPSGFLCTVYEGGLQRVLYVYIREQFRKTGICTSLLKEVYLRSQMPVRVNISENHACYPYMEAACLALGFQKKAPCVVYGARLQDFARWEAFMEKRGDKMTDMLLRHGFRCQSFREAGREILGQLLTVEGAYGNRLDIEPFLGQKNRGMDPDISFVAVKDGRAAAYTLVSRPDSKSAVFEQISSSEDYLQSGVILLPFAGSMQAFKKSGCERAAYAMYPGNFHANAFRRKILSVLTSSETRTENFILES